MTAQAGYPKGEAPPHAGSAAVNQALLQLAGRIESVLEDERRLLAGSSSDALDHVIARKNHIALEVMRVAQHAAGFVPDAALRNRFKETVAMLTENEGLLRRHIAAVDEISSVVAAVISDSTSDGTYSSDAARRGRKL